MLRMIYALVLVLLVSSPSLGQQSLVGTYRLVSHVVEVEGVQMETLGKVPRGHFVLTPTRAIFVVTAQTRKVGGSEPEKAALLDTLSAWSGLYRVDGSKLIIRVDNSWIESWNGKDQVRNWELSGNRLTLTQDPQPQPRPPYKMSTLRQVWEKVE